MRSTGIQPDLGLARGAHLGARRLRDQLRAQADAEERRAALEVLDEERVLAAQPRVLLVLVGVHRAAEDEDGVGGGRGGGGEPPSGTHQVSSS